MYQDDDAPNWMAVNSSSNRGIVETAF